MPRTPRAKRSRAFLLTQNNPTEADIDKWHKACKGYASIQYLCFQLERGEADGTLHVQAFVYTHSKKAPLVVKGWFPGNPHIEIARDLSAAWEYCKKSETREPNGGPFEYGKPPGKFAKLDLITAIKNGASMTDIGENFTEELVLGGATNIEKAIQLNQQHRTTPPSIVVLYGPTASGKTKRALDLYGLKDTFIVPWPEKSSKWFWNGYQNEETIVLDEFRHQITYGKMLRLLDWTPLTVDLKGSSAKMNSKNIIITSNQKPGDWYPNVQNKTHLYRRLREWGAVYYLPSLGEMKLESMDSALTSSTEALDFSAGSNTAITDVPELEEIDHNHNYDY